MKVLPFKKEKQPPKDIEVAQVEDLAVKIVMLNMEVQQLRGTIMKLLKLLKQKV